MDYKKVLRLLSFILLTCPTSLPHMLVYAALAAVLFTVSVKIFDNDPGETENKGYKQFNPLCSLLSAVILVFLVIGFCLRWAPSGIVRTLAGFVSLTSEQLLPVIGIVLGGVLGGGLSMLLQMIYRKSKRIIYGITIANFLALLFLQIQISSDTEIISNVYFPDLYSQQNPFFLLNFLLLLLPILLIYLLTGNLVLSVGITAVTVTLFSVANHYVIEFHGSPLYISEFANAGTAMQVLSGYRLKIDWHVIVIGIFFILQMALFIGLWFDKRKSRAAHRNIKDIMKTLAAVAGVLLSAYIFLLGPLSREDTDIMFSWKAALRRRGFMCCAVTDLQNSIQPLWKPKGYSASSVELQPVKTKEHGTVREQGYPDIILILNESFCDLGEYCDIEIDKNDIPYMEDFYNIPGAAYGHTASSLIGGGTNNSEFELLTSNSMNILRATAPFNYMHLENLQANVVDYAESLGYQTTGMHCGNSFNYNRSNAYPAIGFDQVFLGEEEFTINLYGNRKVFDCDNYNDLIEQYKRADDVPQLMYLLTYQNHGDYSQNDESYDTIHVKSDYGQLTDKLNEYLTSIAMSSKAFHDLTDYFANEDRDVLILMLGDHAPQMITDINKTQVIADEPDEIAQRLVPFVMWSNYGVEFSDKLEYASMIDLVPLLLESAGMPLTPYYTEILALHDRVPLRLANGMYIDTNEMIGDYSPESPYYETLNNYYYMEYNGLSRGADYHEEWFTAD